MSDSYSRENDEHKSREHQVEREHLSSHDIDPVHTGALDIYAGALLGNPRLEGRGNASVHAAVMQSAQKTHGNRAVQRFLTAQRSATATAEPETDDFIAKRIEAKAGTGGALDESIKAKIEAGMGADLSGVRVHTDAEADQLAKSMSATAFTTGSDIFFREGAYNPHTPEGLRLLAHEATHTIQQAAGPVDGTPSAGGVSISDPSDSFEQAAESVADAVASGAEGPVAGGSRVQRLEEGTPWPVQRSLAVQRWPFMGPISGNPFAPLNPFHPMPGGGTGIGWQPPGRGEVPGPWAYGKENTQGGYEGGFGAFHGEGDILGVPVTDDILYARGQLGAWDDGQGGTRYGAGGNAGVANFSINEGGLVSGQAEALTASAEASWGDSGATLGAQATLVGGSMTFGNETAASNTDESVRLGLSEGVGLAGRLHWGDKDKDGQAMYGFGADFGPFSFDIKSEDPLRTLARSAMGPMGSMLGDYLLPGGNMTNTAGEYAGQAWDAAKEYGGAAIDTISDYGNRAWEGAGELWEGAKDYGSQAYDTVAGGLSSAYNTASDYASSAYDTASAYASGAYDTVSGAASDAYDTVSGAASDAYDWLTDW
ncbi:MAG TPA: DUF4157 domain-containing protein [Chloroflexia bacterium]|nr:DUF4157 domain-containing protein [Chloroflexia bacterium]